MLIVIRISTSENIDDLVAFINGPEKKVNKKKKPKKKNKSKKKKKQSRKKSTKATSRDVSATKNKIKSTESKIQATQNEFTHVNPISPEQFKRMTALTPQKITKITPAAAVADKSVILVGPDPDPNRYPSLPQTLTNYLSW